MHVLPAHIVPAEATSRWRRYGTVLIGCGYLGVRGLGDAPSANDLWWSHYTSKGSQALIVDIFNQRLTTRATGPADVLSSAIEKVYPDDATSTTELYPAYPRRLVLLELTSVEYAVANLRALAPSQFGNMVTQYCWVDLAKAFEVAHTTSRQERCASRYSANGAVYFETVLRNQVWDDFIQIYGGDGGVFTIVMLSWLEQVPAGQEWLATTSTALKTTSIAQEAGYWRSKIISHFHLQWHNRWQTGVQETMEIENALGLRSTVTLKGLGYTKTTWTSNCMYWTVFYDLVFMTTSNCSFIRSANNSFTVSPAVDFATFFAVQASAVGVLNLLDLFYATVGPIGAVDTLYVVVPATLLDFYDAFHVNVHEALNAVDLNDVPTLAFQATHPAWSNSNLVFYGGNPMCLYRSALPYVQDTFGFSDPCVSQPPLLVTADKYSSLFAVLALGSQFQPSATCALQSLVPNCDFSLGNIVHVAYVAPFRPAATAAISTLNVGIMQYASHSNGTGWTLLNQALLPIDDAAWAFYGWTILYDWIQGKREVVSFQGDLMSLVLVSSADTPQLFRSDANSVSAATRLLYYLVVHSTFILGALAIGCVASACLLRLQVHGPNLFWFNRIVSSIWIGRPLVFIRGVTAILMLSTTQLSMGQGSSPGSTRFVFAPRPWYATMLIPSGFSMPRRTFSRYSRSTTRLGTLHGVVYWLGWHLSSWKRSGLNYRQACSTSYVRQKTKNMDETITCSGSFLRIGRLDRVGTIIGIFVSSMVVVIALSVVYRWRQSKIREPPLPPRHLLGIADYYLATSKTPQGGPSDWSLDKVSCLMVGLVPLIWNNVQYTLFDMKLWVISRDRQLTRGSTKSFAFHTHALESTSLSTQEMKSSFALPHRIKQIAVGLGMMYAIGSIVSCVSYLQVSRVALANDLFWASFNMTGAHAFLGSWLNLQLVFGTNTTTFQLNAPHINQDGPFDKATAVVAAAFNFGGLMQYSQLHFIEATIRGLRRSDACAAPWIFTQYCFVDFNQTWEHANSAVRQTRCLRVTTNGAVFLESVLRNIRFDVFYTCWGVAFDSGIANDLRRTAVGQIWLSTVSNPIELSVGDEITHWQAHKIVTFVTQWQNFKRIGLVNTYSVQNVFGTSYSFTLQQQDAAFRLNEQSTFKMYWGLASDFAAVASNGSSSLSDLSLIRSSHHFAFADTAMERILIQNGTLVAPVPASFAIFSSVVGPFGSVDMRFLACPAIVTDTLRRVQLALRTVFDPSTNLWPTPKVWIDMDFVALGGDPTCPQLEFRAGYSITGGLQCLLSSSVQRSSVPSFAVSAATHEALIEAVILSNLTALSSDDIARICNLDIGFESVCQLFLVQTLEFVNAFMTRSVTDVARSVVASNAAIRALNIELIQCGQLDSTSPVMLYRLNILDPTQIDFSCFAWLMLDNWAVGTREVVTFEGDNGTLTVLTEQMPNYQTQVSVAEMPTALAFYLRNTVYYITGAMMGIASFMLLYVLISHGMVEVLNCLKLQRVGALVWIGRPLLVVRSLTAIALLSTATLQLVFNGSISYFEVVQDPWYKTCWQPMKSRGWLRSSMTLPWL
ncbi:Aste57867_2285 [Aphanomyces stellatus]|uniref:Aste57867_2285 protein n=1 Tax=Aphanomyces stellatus TaxID=120398 RepID=A0A485KBJ1_9STRA|nr:hypothetical protein As57867_002280 [Aphanomyces stellatus]VFT79488.1 Aste57867_2285 [Aphanomyces stellatus]